MNSVNLIGRLTSDPVKRATTNGTDVTTMRLAIERVGDGSDYVNVAAFGKLALACKSHLAKGRQISVQGRLAHSEWTSKEGERRERHQVIANSVEFLGQRPAHLAPVAMPAA